jgi:hypothetical protein
MGGGSNAPCTATGSASRRDRYFRAVWADVVRAQTITTGDIAGVVRDPSDAVIPSVTTSEITDIHVIDQN